MAKVAGDTVLDFIDNAHKKFGGDDFGATKAEISVSKMQFKDGKVTGLKFTLDVDVDYAEPGGGKPDDANKAAIKELAELVKQHELDHETGYKKAFTDWKADKVAKDIMSKTYKSSKEALQAVEDARTELRGKLKKACLALHAKGGRYDTKVQKDGSITVTEKPAGTSGCDDI